MDKSFMYNGMTFVDGSKITCIIENLKITDAQIEILTYERAEEFFNNLTNDDVPFFIHQDRKRGCCNYPKFGYAYGWITRLIKTKNLFDQSVKNLSLIKTNCLTDVIEGLHSTNISKLKLL